MDENKGKEPTSADKPEGRTHSAFSRHDQPKANEPDKPKEEPIPSQPRSFSPVRPQRASAPRKNLTAPADGSTDASTDASRNEKKDTVSDASKPAGENVGVNANQPKTPPPAPKPAAESSETKTVDPKPADPKSTDAALKEGAASTAMADKAKKPQSSGAGGDTVRLRVTPRTHARTLNTAPGRGLRRRLPDIRQGRSASAASGNYGAFSLFFGFLWLIFKMIFFTLLVLGLGALIGFMVMTKYIKTPEVTVPEVTGMKIDEAFDVLSEKDLGVIKRRTESSGLVAPGEIISQQPPAGSKAKVDTDIGVVISSGRSQFVVPNVVNETKENAMNKVRGARLEVGNVLTLEDSGVPRGNVISQTPIGGTGSDEVIKVDLMVSAGPPGKSLTMPDLAGRTVLEAKAALKAVGVENVVTVPDDAAPDAEVLSHIPLVGKTVFQTDKITLDTTEQ